MDEKAFVIEQTARIARDMISIRDRIFAYAELPYREVRSAELLEKVSGSTALRSPKARPGSRPASQPPIPTAREA